MARPTHPALSPAALEEARRFMAEGERSRARRGDPATPSLRDLARHLRQRGLTGRQTLSAATLARALERVGRCRLSPGARA